MKYIFSEQNQLIKDTVALKEKKHRQKLNQFVVEGFRAIEPFMEQNWPLERLFITHKALESAPDWFKALELEEKAPSSDQSLTQDQQVVTRTESKIMAVSYEVLKRMSIQTTPSGVLAVFGKKRTPLNLDDITHGLVLHQIQDPGNMGTLIRTSVAFDVPCFIIEGCDPWSPKVIQTSAGALAYARLVSFDWQELVSFCKSNMSLCALVLENGSSPDQLDLKRVLLVVGNEAHGLSQDVIDSCDQRMTIPMAGRAESLNAAVAGSVALYASVALSK